MTNKYMKKFSNSLAIKEMQIKITQRFHLTPVRIVIVKKTTIAREEIRGKESLYTVGGNVN
jgi:hypothetical protein